MTERVHAGDFEAGGVGFRVVTNQAGFAALVGDAFRDMRVADAGPAPVLFEVLQDRVKPETHPWGVWRDGEPLQMTVADDYVLAYLLWEVSRLMFERTGDRVHLHGAGLVREGHAIVLAGHSEAGKSTLAGWLTHRGWGFLTDETALVDPDTLMVAPFWRPIGVRRPGPLDVVVGGEFRDGVGDEQTLVPASTIGSLARAAPLAAIALVVRTPGEPATLSPLSAAAALVEMTQHFPGLIRDGRAGFRRLARVVGAIPSYTLRFADLDDAERALRALAAPSS